MAEASERPTQLPRLEPGSIFAGYRIECVIARGGMGVVYKARDVDLDRTVALKIIAPEHTQDETAVARFKAEARIAASLEHPNIVPIHRGGEADGVLYLAMRFVPGTNLREIIDQSPLDLARIGRIISDVGRALDVAHSRGLVHRDVKPANILLSGEGDGEQVYLSDFGLTKRLGSVGDLTRPGGWVGTPDYVAPEQIQGRDVDGRADVYSLGCVLYEMLTGHVAYPKGSDVAKLWAHVADPPPAPRLERPDLVEAFDEVVARATAKDPTERYATPGELAAAVRAAIQQQDGRDRRQPVGGWDSPADDRLAPTRASGLDMGDDVFIGGGRQPQGDPYAGERMGRQPEPDPYAGGRMGRGQQHDPYDHRPPPPAVSPAAAARVDPPVGRMGSGGAPPSGGDEGWLAEHRWPVAGGIAALLIAAGAAVLLLSGGSSSKSGTDTTAKKAAPAGQRISTKMQPVPTNRVTGSGSTEVRLNGNVITVTLTTNGLLDGASHLLHIHAGAKGQCPTSKAAQLHNGHLSIATKAGVPFYGHAVTALTTKGDTSENSILAFNRFPKTGEIRYSRKLRVSPVVASYLRENNAVIVVHGIDYNRNGLYDGTLDRSDLNRSLPGESTAPGLCGVLIADKAKGKSSSGAKAGSKTTGAVPSDKTLVLRASLAPETPAEPPPAWLCHLGGGTVPGRLA